MLSAQFHDSSPRICTVIFGATMKELESKAHRAAKDGAQLVELRLDLCKDPEALTIETIRFPSLETILTVRDPHEGGTPLPSETRTNLLQRALQSQADYVDVEISNFDAKILQSRSSQKLILSKHWFNAMPPIQELEELCKRYSSYGILKLVPTAQSYQDNFTLLAFVARMTQQGAHLVSFCMGEKGVPSRVLSLMAGGLFSYACLDEPVALGQLQTTVFRRLYHEMLGQR